MIVQTLIVILILSVALICDVTSYSNVYVESEVVPLGYYSYGTPYPSIANPRLSQINTLPSVPDYVAPCVSPCVYQAPTVATATPVNLSPNVLTYNAPSVPIVVAPTKQETTGYEYSYVVYDENTGDHKAQRELSDGSVVRGEYSFLQPDGYVRQVQYIADDISGFNAVVKQFLPAAVEGHRKVEGQENKESSPSCHENKTESLKEALEENLGEISIKKLNKIQEKLHKIHSNDESAEKSMGHHGTSKESGEEENFKKTKNVYEEEAGEKSEAESHQNQSKKPKHSKEESGNESKETSKEKPHMKPKHSKEESEEKFKENPHMKPKHPKEDSGEASEENPQEEVLHIEELKEKSRKKSTKETEESREQNKKKSKKGSKEGSHEDSGDEPEEVGHGKHKEVHELLKPNQEVDALLKPNQEALVPYNDIIRCIEAAMRRNYGVPAAMRQEPSPLTYIVLNKPC